MSRVKREITIRTAQNLRALISGVEGKGTTSRFPAKQVRKALDRMTTEDGTPLTFTDRDKNVRVCMDETKPLYLCPECEVGYLAKNKKGEWQACTNKEKGSCLFHGNDYEEDEDDIVGYQPLKINGKRPRFGWIELPKRLIVDTIWKKILLPELEKQANVAKEDQIEYICDDFEIDGLPDRFEMETTNKEEPEPEEKIIDAPEEAVEMPRADGPASLLKEDDEVPVSTR